ncbi:MAG: hypothetical protein WA981_17660 [Glaciecola sp.]
MNVLNATAQSAIYSGLEGYNNGSNSMTNASREFAKGNNGSPIDVNRAAIDLVSGSLQAEASAKVIHSADSMLGTIIDTFA